MERLGSFISSLGLYGRGTSMPLLYPMYGIAEVRDPETLSVSEGFKVVNLVSTIFVPWHGKLFSVFPKLRNSVLVAVVHQDVYIYLIAYILEYVLAIHDHPPGSILFSSSAGGTRLHPSLCSAPWYLCLTHQCHAPHCRSGGKLQSLVFFLSLESSNE